MPKWRQRSGATRGDEALFKEEPVRRWKRNSLQELRFGAIAIAETRGQWGPSFSTTFYALETAADGFGHSHEKVLSDSKDPKDT